MFLASITHDVRTNTLEAKWLEEVKDSEGSVVSYQQAKCQSYSSEQKAEFDADTGTTKYSDMAGW